MRRVVSGTGTTFGLSTSGWETEYLLNLLAYASHDDLLIDVAQVYGGGRAEGLLGRLLGECPNIDIMTKLRVPNARVGSGWRELCASLESLRRQHVAFLCTHWTGTPEQFLDDIHILLRAKDEGLATEIGLSNPSSQDLTFVQSLGAAKEFSFVQSEFSLADRSVLQSLRDTNFHVSSVFGYSPLCEGRLAPNARARGFVIQAARLAGVSPSVAVLRWLMTESLLRPITLSRHRTRHLENLESEDVNLSDQAFELLQIASETSQVEVALGMIDVEPEDFKGRCFLSLEEALANTLDMSPSPLALAEQFLAGNAPLKPLKVRCNRQTGRYQLLQGQLRYWALRVAFGTDRTESAILFD